MIVYVPAGVPAGTSTSPVVGLSVGTGSPGLFGVAGVTTLKVALLVVAGAPFSVSPSNAFVTAVAPVAPLIPAALSFVATITAKIVSLSVAVLLELSSSIAPDGAVIVAVLTAC